MDDLDVQLLIQQRDHYALVMEQILELAQQGEGRICRTIAQLASEAIEPPAEGA